MYWLNLKGNKIKIGKEDNSVVIYFTLSEHD